MGKNSVGNKQIKRKTVTAAKIDKNAVTTAKIRNRAVTGAKVNEDGCGDASEGKARAVDHGNHRKMVEKT